MKKNLHIVCLFILQAITAGGYAAVFTELPPESFNTADVKFTENKGQILDEKGKPRTDILFAAKGQGVQFYLTKKGIIYNWVKRNNKNSSKTKGNSGLLYEDMQSAQTTVQQVYMELLGANPNVEMISEQPTPDVANYFTSAYPEGIRQVRSFWKVTYKEIYPNINLVLYTNGHNLKYDFVVNPGGNVKDIQFTYQGDKTTRLRKNGSLVVSNPLGKLTEGKPFTYQGLQSEAKEIASTYHLQRNIISFQIGKYDTTQTLVIDPSVTWATFYGGEEDDRFAAIKNDQEGNIYAVGLTYSHTNISTNPNQIDFLGNNSTFILKFNAQKQLQWATYYLNGSIANDMAIDNTGNIYVCGSVAANLNPSFLYNTHQPAHAGGNDAFLVKIKPNGEPEWATYYGGEKDEEGNVIAVAPDGHVVLSGRTNSQTGIATSGTHRDIAYNPNCNSATDCEKDVFLVKFNANGQRIWGTYFGGMNKEESQDVLFDKQLNVYICGSSASPNISEEIPAIAFGSYVHQKFRDGAKDNPTAVSSGFVAKFSPEGKGIWGTYYGDGGYDAIRDIDIDENDNLYLTGDTQSSNYISSGSNVHQSAKLGNQDGFIVKFNSSGKRQWGTYYGGSEDDGAIKVVYNGNGYLYILGNTRSNNRIAAGNSFINYGFRNNISGDRDAYVCRFDTTGKRVWGAYYGDTDEEFSFGLTASPTGTIYITGYTKSSIAMPPNSFRSNKDAGMSGFITLIDDDPFVTLFSPGRQAIEVLKNSNLEITFDEPVTKGIGNITLKQNGVPLIISVSDPTVVVSNNKVIIDTADFALGSTIEVTMDGTAFKDATGNYFPGLSSGTWKFTIETEKIAPTIATHIPKNDSVGVLKNSNLEIIFDEPIVKGTGNITIIQNGVRLPVDVTSAAVSISGNKATIDIADFVLGNTVEVELDDSTFKDLSGNYFAGLSSGNWKFTIESDKSAPIIIQRTPVIDSVGVGVYADLEIVFDEAIVKDSGKITIKQGDTSLIIPFDSISVEGNKASIKLPPLNLGAVVEIEIEGTAFKDLFGNYFEGISPGVWKFTIVSQIKISPSVFAPVPITHTGIDFDLVTAPDLSIELSYDPAGTVVELYYRGISNEKWQKETIQISGNKYTAAVPVSVIDKIGLEYYFKVTPPAVYGEAITSSTGIVYINRENGVDFQLQAGASKNSYRIISVPLQLESTQVESVFSNLGVYNDDNWRLFRIQNDSDKPQEYKQADFSDIEPGRAYWLISRNGGNINTKKGSTFQVRQADPYIITLKPGWNLIGSPYEMNVLWEDIIAATDTQITRQLEGLYTYEDGNGYNDFGNLNKFSGGFVRSYATEDINIKIPALYNAAANPRLSAERDPYNPESLFEVNFILQSQSMRYRLGGLGMHPEASYQRDRFDRTLLPRFIDYLDIQFASTDNAPYKFTKDIIPVEEGHVWEFTVETNTVSPQIDLNWENYFSQASSKQLYLYDVDRQSIVDMRSQSKYTFNSSSASTFRVLYGNELYINKHLRPERITLHQNTPNPFSSETTIPFTLPDLKDSYQVQLHIYNSLGQQVATLTDQNLTSGFHSMQWNGKDKSGNKLPAGLYIGKLFVAGEKQRKEYSVRMILK